jgi:anti-sigma regulatory factor (Ser/Thr protein kinase)
MDTASTEELTLSGAPESVRAARDFVRRVLDEATTPPEAVEEAALLVSELVTNAVIHTDADVCLRVRTGPVARIEVQDEGGPIPESAVPPAGSPGLPRAAEAVEPGGLGLAIVATLASRWGVDDPRGPGKVVWFELDVAT